MQISGAPNALKLPLPGRGSGNGPASSDRHRVALGTIPRPAGGCSEGTGPSFLSTMTAQPHLPHPIPYQGSKRKLAPLIAPFVPADIDTWYEPFAGSAAMTIFAAHHRLAKSYVISDALRPICELWTAIIDEPAATARRYEEVWNGQTDTDKSYFNQVRDRYNQNQNPVDLLYLICRCVKNAIRFNRHGHFTQSHDRRRLGMSPDRMESAIRSASRLLKGKTRVCCGDWLETLSEASPADFIYLDPPYLGTSIGRDRRYAQQLEPDRLVAGLVELRSRGLRFVLSYDGMTGERTYGEPLPGQLGLSRLWIHAGRSSQATLAGRREDTVESLYLTPNLGLPGSAGSQLEGPQTVRLEITESRTRPGS